MATAFKFAHLTDLHLPIPGRPGLRELLGKRALGYLSWLRRRRRWHQPAIASALIADMKAQGCDCAVLSGDVVNLSLAAEFEAARIWLAQAFGALPLVVAPGNHDAYVTMDWNSSLGLLGAQMVGVRGDDPVPRPPGGPSDFPFVVSFGREDVSLIVANSATPTAPGLASGALGGAQLRAIERELRAAVEAARFAVLMLHHPINDGVVSRRKALVDRADLAAAIARSGVDLVLHGHAHVAHFGETATPTGTAPVIGGGSVSHPGAGGHFRPGRYNHFTLETADDAHWRLTLTVREFDPATKTVQTVDTRIYRRRKRVADRSPPIPRTASAET